MSLVTITRGRAGGPRRIAAVLVPFIAVCLVNFTAFPAQAEQQAVPEGGAPPVGGETRLGNIELDRRMHTFRVTGTLKRVTPPLEYLAVSREGIKAYESLLELDVGGRDLNTACILIGLEPPSAGMPRFQFDRNSIAGQAVGLRIGWETASGPMAIDAGHALTLGGREVGEAPWVYIGSQVAPGGGYLAEQTGTLIGFVHDPISVIEHREGLGIGAYGSVGGNEKLLPPPGSKIWIQVTNLGMAPEARSPKSETRD